MQSLDERKAKRTIMVSPFVRVVTYTVLDGYRIVAAHNQRHIDQARRVLQSPGFPSAVIATALSETPPGRPSRAG
jgi:hypothetical protein